MRPTRQLTLILFTLCAGCPSSKSGTGADMAGSAANDADAAQTDTGNGNANLPQGCDMSGEWVAQHITTNSALDAPQVSTNWSYLRFEQKGTKLRIVDALDCGYVVRGTTDVSLGDATLEAMAIKSTNATGVAGTLETSKDGKGCAFALDRIYSIRGANQAKFLDALWKIGDAPKALSEFTLPTSGEDGMEDWDDDAHDGLTQLTGLGDRYTAQLDWHAFHGTLPLEKGVLGAGVLGGMGVLVADYDAKESVSTQTPALLRTSSVPVPPGYALLMRAGSHVRTTTGAHPELDSCKAVQAFAVEHFGDPATP